MIRRFLAFIAALVLVACGSALDTLTVQAEWQLAQLEDCYAAELAAIEDYPEPYYSVAILAAKAKYSPVFEMYRAYTRAVVANDEEQAQELFALFSAMAAGASARCLATIPAPVESVP